MAAADRARWSAAADALERWKGPAESLVWARFYGFAVRKSLDSSSWDEPSFRAVSSRAKGRYVWMRWLTGVKVLRRGRWEDAASELAGVAKEFPQMITAVCSLSEALLGLRRPKEALLVLETARPFEPMYRAAWWAWKGEILLWLRRYAEAEACLARAGDYRLALCWRGAAAVVQGRPDEAVRLLDEAVRLIPGDAEAWTWRTEANRLNGDLRRACADAEEALSRSPENVFVLINRALARAALSNRRGLIEDFEAIRGADGPLQERLRPLDPIWSASGAPSTKAAVAALERALSAAGGNRRVDYSLMLSLESPA